MDEQQDMIRLYLEAEETPAVHPPWLVKTEADATWAADRVMQARERRDRIVERCEALLERAGRDVQRTEAFFLPLLEDWARRNPPVKGKTIHLPTASLSFRRVPGGPRVVDDAAALLWARTALPAAVVITERVDKEAVKRHVTATGELPPGVELKPDDESFSVK